MSETVIRISSAGSCPRRIQLEAWGVEGEPLPESTLRAFEEGHLLEPSILDWAAKNLPGAPFMLTSKQMEVRPRPWLVGHIDAIGLGSMGSKPVLLEAKCLKRRAFQELREKGARESHPQYHAQVQLYMYGLQEAGWAVDRAYLVARNKETPAIRWWDHVYEHILYDPDFVKQKIAELEELRAAIEQRREVEPPFHPDKDWQCRFPWCPYSRYCWPSWKKPMPEVTDRSDLETVAEMFLQVQEERKALEQFESELKEQLLQACNGAPVGAGRFLVELQERRQERFDAKLARQVLSADVISQLVKVSVSRVLTVKEGARCGTSSVRTVVGGRSTKTCVQPAAGWRK